MNCWTLCGTACWLLRSQRRPSTALCTQWTALPATAMTSMPGSPPKACSSSGADSSDGEQAVEEFAVVHQSQAQIFSGRLLPLRPLFFQPGPCLSESGREVLDQIGNQVVCLLDALLGIVHECGLDASPPRTQIRDIVAGEKHFCG